ncbi:MAG: DUF3530 family protein [Pseudomonadales bacterium]
MKFYVQRHPGLKRLIHAAHNSALLALLALAVPLPQAALAQEATTNSASLAAEQGAGKAGEKNPLRDEQSDWMQRYMAGQPAKDALWLGVGEKEGEEPFVAFSQQAVGAHQLGLVLLASTAGELTLPGWRRHIYNALPLHGWSTLATLLPVAPLASARSGPVAAQVAGNSDAAPGGRGAADAETPDTSADANADNPVAGTGAKSDDNDHTAAADARALQRLQTAGRWLLDQGARSYALMSDGKTLDYAVQGCIATAGNCSGLVLWRVAESELGGLPLETLQQSRVSILDVIDGQPDAQARLRRQRHFHAAGFDKDYLAIVLPPADDEATYAQSVKRLRHWLQVTFSKQ